MKRWLSAALAILITVCGFSLLSWATDGWTAWTAEAARRRSVLTEPRQLADIAVQRDNGSNTTLYAFTQPVLLVEFIFTRCQSVCLAMGAEFRQIQLLLASTDIYRNVQLLSISFDQENDGPRELSEYLDRFSAERISWSALRVLNKGALTGMLDTLGVVVLPEPTMGFVHNAAVYVVKDHAVVGIYDFDDSTAVMARIRNLVQSDIR